MEESWNASHSQGKNAIQRTKKQISDVKSRKEELRQAIELLVERRETDELANPLKDELSKLQIERAALEAKVHAIVKKSKDRELEFPETKQLKEIQADSASKVAVIEQLKHNLRELRDEHMQLLTNSSNKGDQQTEELEKKAEELNKQCESLRAESRVLQTQLDGVTEEALREQFNRQEQVLKRLRAKKLTSIIDAFDTGKSSTDPLTSKNCRCSLF